MINRDLQNPLYHFLIGPKFRWCRHVILLLSMGTILANHIHITYEEQTDKINIYWIMALYMLIYLSILYLNLYLLIPRLLLKAKYMEYAIIVVGVLFLFLLGDICTEYYVHKYHNIPFGQYSFFYPERNKFVDLFSNFFIFMLYLVSVSVFDSYKHWIINTTRVERLKAKQLHSELDNLKSRIGTEFLLTKLHKAAKFCNTCPVKSSRILLQLSHVLRYQLYDCSRGGVLLSSEIKVLKDYLNLEKICNGNLDFNLIAPPTLPNCFIPPLLLISIVEESLKRLSDRKDTVWIKIGVNIIGRNLIFTCTDNRNVVGITKESKGYSNIFERLELLQNRTFELSTSPDSERNQYKAVLQYKI